MDCFLREKTVFFNKIYSFSYDNILNVTFSYKFAPLKRGSLPQSVISSSIKAQAISYEVLARVK